ncbi:hypothetical protein Hanom_Chr02g00168501 [Helianthus anomalus]
MYNQKLRNYIKLQAKNRFPDWKPHFREQIVKYDLIIGEKDVTLKIKVPRCLKNMPLCAMEQDFYEDFQGWVYNQSTAEAVISLFDKKTGEARRINDIDCLFFNKIVYDGPDKAHAQQYQKMANLCFAKDINSGRYWESKFRDLELEEFLKREKRSEKFKKIREKAAVLGHRTLSRPPPTDQTPIESEEKKISRWDRKRDGDPVYRKYWNEIGRPLRRKILAEQAEARRQKAKASRRSRKVK